MQTDAAYARGLWEQMVGSLLSAPMPSEEDMACAPERSGAAVETAEVVLEPMTEAYDGNGFTLHSPPHSPPHCLAPLPGAAHAYIDASNKRCVLPPTNQ